MPYDLTRSYFDRQIQRPVATGQTVDSEGLVLRGLLEDGVEVVQPADAGAANYRIVGFSVSDNESIASDVVIESVTIPNTGAADETVQLSKTNLVGTAPAVEVMVKRADTGVVMTQQTLVGDVNATNEYFVDAATGLVTFDTADAGVAVTIQYRYNMTVLEARLKFFQRSVNNEAGAVFGEVSVGLAGEVYTLMYDAAVDWSDASVAPTSGAGGLVTDGGAGTAIPNAEVTHVPTAERPYLGLRFNCM